MKNIERCLSVLLFSLFIYNGVIAQSAVDANAVIGIFKSEDGKKEIEFYKDGGSYFGKIVSVAGSKGKVKPGTIVFKNFIYDHNKWIGKVYVPARDADYDATIILINQGKINITVRVGLISQTKQWTRLQK